MTFQSIFRVLFFAIVCCSAVDVATLSGWCRADPVCAKLYGLSQSMPIPSALAIANALAAAGVDPTTADAPESNTTQLAIMRMTIGRALLPPCPYGTVYIPNGTTGSGSCICPPGGDCGRPCSSRDAWIAAACACAIATCVAFALRVLLFSSL